MDAQSKKLLVQVRDGVTIFEPAARSSRELLQFQEAAGRLMALERAGLIGRCVVEEAEIAGQRYFNAVCVFQGITPAGERLLEECPGGQDVPG